jgi:hypothetical protein
MKKIYKNNNLSYNYKKKILIVKAHKIRIQNIYNKLKIKFSQI